MTLLDDSLLEPLPILGKQRIKSAADFSPAAILALLYPTEEERMQWWQQFWESAAPLWHYDETRQVEQQRASPSGLTLIYCQNAADLKGLLPFLPDENIRWISGSAEGLLILRMRGGIPLITN
jgi:hypothetical protein